MISVTEAQEKIIASVAVGKTVTLTLSEAPGSVLCKAIYSPLDLPSFDNSAMDGYAIDSKDYFPGKKFEVTGESSAGKSFRGKLTGGKAIRIFTGAEIPDGANAVVMQEKVSVHGSHISVEDENLKPGLNIRSKGSQIKKGDLALAKGTELNPAALGFIASMGLGKVAAFSKPSASLIITGNELQKPGTKLSRGKIFESNSAAVISALRRSGIENIKNFFVVDDAKQTLNTFRKALRVSDFILFTGGISAGDYDFAGCALRKEKVSEVFYKVRQKPGKPLYFGTKNKKYIFGLPGNPASVLTCFYEYVLPAIRKFSGYENCFLPALSLPLSKSIQKKKGLTHFLKAITDYKTVAPLEGQESHIMKSYAEANCLVSFPEEAEALSAGDVVDVHLL